MSSSFISQSNGFNGPEGQEDMPYLLTPGPLTTSSSVKQAMLADWGSRDIEFRHLVTSICSQLVNMANPKTSSHIPSDDSLAGDEFECVLMQGAGTFAIEAGLGAFCPTGRKKKTLVVINGAYGQRAVKILHHLKRPVIALEFDEEGPVETSKVETALEEDSDIETVFIVHCETTTGVINPLKEICQMCKAHGKTVFVDAMSSFGALELNMAEYGIDIMVSSANKCIEGVPGFGYVICRRALLEAAAGKSHSVSLDLYDQWNAMQKTSQFRFTPPHPCACCF